jgi:hypothetical protein
VSKRSGLIQSLGEGRIELLAEIFREAGAVALNEAVLGAAPFAQDIDGIVELIFDSGKSQSIDRKHESARRAKGVAPQDRVSIPRQSRGL